MRILVAGDTHMNQRWARVIVDVAKANNVDAIFQVGDFGYCFDYFFLKPFIEAPMPVYFVPGNHDNYEFLTNTGAHGVDVMTEIWDNVWHVPRSYTWNWDGKSFAACGGAYSIDQDHRTTYLSYWPEETITQADIIQAEKMSRKVDFMFTHDVPHGVPKMEEAIAAMRGIIPERHENGSAGNRMALRKIVEEFEPNLLIHGHMHAFYVDDLVVNGDHKIEILGLDCDGNEDSICILDTDTGLWHIPPIRQSMAKFL